MNERYQQFYQELQAALIAAGPRQSTPMEEIQFRFQLAFQYTHQLPLADCPITSIEYFKQWIPRFVSESRYYELIYHAETFRPTRGLHARKSFWVRESNRLTKKIEEFPELYGYYQGKGTDRDEEIFDTDPDASERNARIWADFMALERYQQYLDNTFQRFF
jgi:hypothetical protein